MSKKAEMAVYDYNMLFFAEFDYFAFIEEHKFLLRNIIDWAEDGHHYVDDDTAKMDKYYECSACKKMIDYEMKKPDDVGICLDCYHCGVCGCNCDETSDEEGDVDDVDAPNTYPYKKCSVCSDRKSCGNYDNDKTWFCEDCYEEPETE
jgi:hypothetical protein